MRQVMSVGLLVGLLLLCGGAANAASKCDRACLQVALDRYLSAVVQHNPANAGLDGKFRYTENASVLQPGDGLWKSATALGKVQRRYFDPVSGQAAFFGLIEEGETSGVATVRIRVVNKKVTEGEVVIGRKVDLAFDPQGLIARPPPPESSTAHAASRESLLAAAQSYFEGLAQHDGALVVAHKGCYRIENGLLLTGRPIAGAAAGPQGQAPVTDCATLDGFASTISGVSHRRFPLVDESAGVVLGMGILERPPGAKRNDGSAYPRNLLTEYFVIEDKRIRGIYAAMHYMTPEDANAPGWK
jgi:hypothetical protein